MYRMCGGAHLTCGFFWLDYWVEVGSLPTSELFFSALVQLLHKLSVRAADGPQKLLKVKY